MSTRVEAYQNAPEVEGRMVYEKDWYLLEVPAAFHQLLIQQLERDGKACKPNKRPHISVMKKEADGASMKGEATKRILKLIAELQQEGRL